MLLDITTGTVLNTNVRPFQTLRQKSLHALITFRFDDQFRRFTRIVVTVIVATVVIIVIFLNTPGSKDPRG